MMVNAPTHRFSCKFEVISLGMCLVGMPFSSISFLFYNIAYMCAGGDKGNG